MGTSLALATNLEVFGSYCCESSNSVDLPVEVQFICKFLALFLHFCHFLAERPRPKTNM
jgi:hypothetical protein